ncbi:hypothetical protein K435DRAFT_872896 [Dendrothele bispora CBS 962.96]|uniref:F-box domain-containing protein n=1 Tax=Dendrothele bispora (strain CBS 962.96) TaxID=1314807 RepID=A0A4S8L0D7_DENBC|nr:hypothetical protein K435DRAFT_872896 [Dendrothele bispora CBS 962.96]
MSDKQEKAQSGSGIIERSHRHIMLPGALQEGGDSGFEGQRVELPGDNITETFPPRKKPRVSSTSSKKATKVTSVDEKFKRVRGKLGLLNYHKIATEIPLDVIFEIFSYLEPLDILRLSRTSRDLRNLLTTRSSECVWRSARLNIEGLPPLPPDLNEIRYANLMFDTTCQVCGRTCNNIYWECRIRCCKKCIPNPLGLLPIDELHLNNSPMILSVIDIPIIMGYVPKVYIRRRKQPVALPSAFLSLSNDYSQNVKVPNEKGDQIIDDEKLAAWKLTMKTKQNEHQNYTRLCENWQRDQRINRFHELRELRAQRRTQIQARLTELGYDPDLKRAMLFANHEVVILVEQSKLLTDREWSRIGPKLITLLKPYKDRRLEDEKSAALRLRYTTLKDLYDNYISEHNLKESGYPPFGDFIESHICRDIIYDTPYDQTLPEDAFNEDFKKIPEFIDDWKEHKKQQLIQLVQKELPGATMDSLSLAKTIFICGDCRNHLWYPGILQHSCLSQTSGYQKYTPSNLDLYHNFNPFDQFNDVPWGKRPGSSGIHFSKADSQDICDLLKMCELDPNTITLENFQVLNDAAILVSFLNAEDCS